MTSFIEIRGKIFEGVFERRLTRFSALVRVNGEIEQCFLPNPGRLRELLISGVKVILKEAEAVGERKTIYDLLGVYSGGKIVSIDSRLPNKLVLEALKNGDLPEFLGYTMVKPEYSYGHVKFDFFLSDGRRPCLLEVKSCTLVRNGVAMFPDAPTERGTRHVLELAKALNEGYRAAVLFVIQRMDAYMFTPNDETDPNFGEALRKAAESGVEVYAYSTNFNKNRISLCGKVKVAL
ncbi:MAG: DNA/RNA nuclease SfsA [Candidatus Bathyarchaeota archaeon]|nr:DNA/RNA nuclease SfsA [Candidatus Bathyarchaeota archaeon A05DMB-3]MDH7607563.1 DNA/RNA nuclease SfsA [Candidatus Bathyarchaeota archaeon]